MKIVDFSSIPLTEVKQDKRSQIIEYLTASLIFILPALALFVLSSN